MPDDTNQSNNQNAPSPSPTNSTPYVPVNQPVGTTPYGSRPPQKISRKKKLYIIGGIGLAILVAGLTIGAMFFWGRFVQPQPAVEPPATLDTLGDMLVSGVSRRDSTSVLTATPSDPFAVIDKVGEHAWVGLSRDARVLAFSSTVNEAARAADDYAKLASLLKDKKFTEVNAVSSAKVDYSETEVSSRYFASDTLACVLSSVHVTMPAEEADTETTHTVSVSCAEKTAFEKTQQDAAPYITAYFANRTGVATDVVFGTPEVQNGAMEGYKYARVVALTLGNNMAEVPIAEFYQVPNSDSWKLFTVAVERDKIPCSQYNSEELTNVYSGFSCWDEAAKSASYVQAKAPTFEIEAGAIGG